MALHLDSERILELAENMDEIADLSVLDDVESMPGMRVGTFPIGYTPKLFRMDSTQTSR